ncbi:MAG TPA: YdcH family protein [Thermoanaerobaculia bacterium]|nr:YdcH family protein [Thermoanaerobaculia bacterium]
MAQTNQAVGEDLAQTEDQLRRLREEHQECERRLEEINQRSLLSQEDEIEEKRLKLHKLHLKDRIEMLLREMSDAKVSA